VELAILYKRSKEYEKAHHLFSVVQNDIQNDPKALHEYAQTKMRLTGKSRSNAKRRSKAPGRDVRRKLNLEAAEILRSVISLAADWPTRAAWAWYDLARVMAWLEEPESEVSHACKKAIELEPGEKMFREWLEKRYE